MPKSPELLLTLTHDSEDYYELLARPEISANHTPTHYRLIDVDKGEIVWQKLKERPVTGGDLKPIFVYTPAILDEICQEIASGRSLTHVCDGIRYPTYAQFCRWRRMYPEVNTYLEAARKDRAESLRDQALDEAMQTTTKDEVPAQNLKVNTLKWLSGVDDVRYKESAKIDVAMSAPTQIIVNTGIDRAPRTIEEAPVERIED